MNEKEEQIYIEGEAQAFKKMISHFQNELRGLGVELKTKDQFDQERIDTIATLRQVCREHGDNDWPDDLHLSDIINKHLIRYFE